MIAIFVRLVEGRGGFVFPPHLIMFERRANRSAAASPLSDRDGLRPAGRADGVSTS